MKQFHEQPSASRGKNCKRQFRRHFLPNRENLHTNLRLAFGGLANVVLIVWVIPHIGNIRKPEYSLVNALRPAIEVVIPSAALLIMAPVFFLGRDIPRLLAIGLAFLPAYVAIAGFGAILGL